MPVRLGTLGLRSLLGGAIALAAGGCQSATSSVAGATPDAAVDASTPSAPGAPDAAPLDASSPSSPDAAVEGGLTSDGGTDAAPPVGATTPFVSYEAETGQLGGSAAIHALTAAPTTQYSSAELEASGHAYVALTASGDSVTWTNGTGGAVTAINVRYSIPDAPNGGGIQATLDLYVNGSLRQALPVTSAQTWLYENDSNYNGNDQNPADGQPRVFFDDVHAFLTGAPIQPGDTLRLQKDAAHAAAF
ncbi:MAG TPA: hypothetical protein VGI39_12330, partial [Polyangiaceae bacterium]